MRLRNGLVKHAKARLGRVLSKRRRARSGRVSAIQRRRPATERVRWVGRRRRPAAERVRPVKRRRPRGAAVVARLSRGRIGRAVVTYGQARLDRAVVKHGADRVARTLVVLVVLLMGGGTAAALAMLPSGLPGPLGDGNPDEPAPSRIAEGFLEAEVVQPRRAGPAYYARTAKRRVPASTGSSFLPLYREAGRTFGVSWRLLASIHRQETAFSTAPTTYHGLNAFGCCAGPMQFNVSNGPPSTWALYKQSFRAGDRPRRYPHPTRHHPSIYDDFDAIMAAGALLRDSGATELLDGGAWTAAYAYYGHDDYGVTYASEVVARAQGWEIHGFCLNCPVDGALVAALDDAYGVDARKALLTAEERAKLEKERRKKRKREKAARARQRAAEKAAAEDARRLEELRRPSRDKGRRDATPAPTATIPAPTSTTTTPQAPPATEAPPPADQPPAPCTGLKKLLGCG